MGSKAKAIFGPIEEWMKNRMDSRRLYILMRLEYRFVYPNSCLCESGFLLMCHEFAVMIESIFCPKNQHHLCALMANVRDC